MTSEHVDVTHAADGAVGRITFDRPERNNSMDQQAADELQRAAIDLVEDDAVRCIVLTGTGGAFNTGADLTALSGDGSDGATVRRIAGALHGMVSQLARAPKPVVCGVNGVAAGGGVGPAICGDVVLAAESARFEFAYPRIGLSADGGSSYFLPRLVGLREAQRIAFRDEPVGAGEAADIGLATEAVPDDEFEERLAAEAARLAEGPTLAHAATKGLLRSSLDRSLDEQLATEAETIAGLTATEDFSRGLDAFLGEGGADFQGE
ncbi:enoyl-CoA hydratase/isomerase family protein [Haloglomus salinum]|jgi:2-(1,2-epoxy-1,2-dihydrophenyl)acetyl-CoA isomerase|uniref:enoyl-CoA hydratase/isomerase family protein n=1 Tax=Haloglomus salinum TaxID=2962673 RepID=UPI0020C957D7|nr:enoyl-CoA hydratase/isomerase family protein [Haloglomus salinum]